MLLEAGLHVEHRALDDVRGRALDGGVERGALGHVPQLTVVRAEVRQVAAAPLDRRGVPVLPGLCDDVAQVVAHAAEAVEVALHEAARLVHRDLQLLGQPEGGQPVGQAVAHRLHLGALLRRDLVRVHAEHLRADERVQVLALAEGLDQPLVLGQVRHDAHLDLGVVRGEQHGLLAGHLVRHEHLADAAARLGAHRDVLEVRVQRGQSARGGGGLRVGGVDAVVRGDGLEQPLHGLPQLRGVAVGHQVLEERVPGLLEQVLQRVHVRGVAGLRLARARHVEPLEQHLLQLLGRAEVDLHPAGLLRDGRPRGLLGGVGGGGEVLAQVGQGVDVDGDACQLHPGEQPRERDLELLQQPLRPAVEHLGRELGRETAHHPGGPHGVRGAGRAVGGGLTPVEVERPLRPLLSRLARGGEGGVQMRLRQRLERGVPPVRLDQVGREQHVVHHAVQGRVRAEPVALGGCGQRLEGALEVVHGLGQSALAEGLAHGGHQRRVRGVAVEGDVQARVLTHQRDPDGRAERAGHGHLAAGQQGRALDVHVDAEQGAGLRGEEGTHVLGRRRLGELGGGLDLGGRRVLAHPLAEHLEHALPDAVELQRVEQLLHGLALGHLEPHRLEPDRQVEVAHEGVEAAVAAHVLEMLAQRLPLLARDLVRVRQHAVEVPVLLQPFRGEPGADAGHAGQVVRGLADEGRELGVLGGGDPVLGQDGVRVHRRDVGDALLGVEHRGALGDELERVPVTGDDDGLPPRLLGARGQCGHDVVGLVALQRERGDAQGLHDLHGQLDLARELRGRLGAAGLVLRVLLGAERGPGEVERHGHVRGPLLPDHGQEHGGEAIHGVRVLARVRGEVLGGQRVERAERHRVPVQDQQPLWGLWGRICRHGCSRLLSARGAGRTGRVCQPSAHE